MAGSEREIPRSSLISWRLSAGLIARLAEDAAGYMLTWPQTYAIDTVLVPALRDLVRSTIAREPAVQRLRDACLAHLRARIAEPLAPPHDWSRASVLPCQCRHCAELSRFLADPERKAWAFKAVEADRSHVEQTIQRAHCDVDLTTDRRGRPYTLVCTKNQASYDRRAKQRRKDLEDVIHLGGGDISRTLAREIFNRAKVDWNTSSCTQILNPRE